MPYTLLAAFAIIGVAAAAQVVTGFGFALLAVPLLTLVTSVESAVVAGTLASFVLIVGVAIHERAYVRWRTATLLMAVAMAGMPLGYLMLIELPGRDLSLVVGAAVLASTLLVWRRPRLGGGPWTVAAVGFLVGVLTTSTGTNGPPLVAAFQSMDYPPRAFRATIAAVFTGCSVVGIGIFAVGGQITREAALICAAGLPALAIGWVLGDRVFHRIGPERFRVVVLVALVVAASITIARAIYV